MFAVLDLKLITFFHLSSHLEQINSLFQTQFTSTVCWKSLHQRFRKTAAAMHYNSAMPSKYPLFRDVTEINKGGVRGVDVSVWRFQETEAFTLSFWRSCNILVFSPSCCSFFDASCSSVDFAFFSSWICWLLLAIRFLLETNSSWARASFSSVDWWQREYLSV